MEKKHKSYFVTSTGTNVGKTFILCSLVNMLVNKGYKVSAIKPIISGWDINDPTMDSLQIIENSKLSINKDIDNVSPWRFKEPLSPDIAANRENKSIDFEKLVNFCSKSLSSEYNFIEGVGGIMVPISQNKTILDLIKSLDIPIILIIGNYLGSISHTLTALEVIKAHSISVKKIVFTENEINSIDTNEVLNSIKNFTNIPIVKIPNVTKRNLYRDYQVLNQIIL